MKTQITLIAEMKSTTLLSIAWITYLLGASLSIILFNLNFSEVTVLGFAVFVCVLFISILWASNKKLKKELAKKS